MTVLSFLYFKRRGRSWIKGTSKYFPRLHYFLPLLVVSTTIIHMPLELLYSSRKSSDANVRSALFIMFFTLVLFFFHPPKRVIIQHNPNGSRVPSPPRRSFSGTPLTWLDGAICDSPEPMYKIPSSTRRDPLYVELGYAKNVSLMFENGKMYAANIIEPHTVTAPTMASLSRALLALRHPESHPFRGTVYYDSARPQVPTAEHDASESEPPHHRWTIYWESGSWVPLKIRTVTTKTV